MKATRMISILLTFTISAFGAMAAAQISKEHPPATQAETAQPGSHMLTDVVNESQHVLAMAYYQNLSNFAKTLHEQMGRTASANTAFAREAVVEMRHSFDQMKKHHQEQMQTLSAGTNAAMTAEMRAKMAGMVQQMETHQTELNTLLGTLEREVQSAAPDPKKVSALAASISSELDGMSMMKM